MKFAIVSLALILAISAQSAYCAQTAEKSDSATTASLKAGDESKNIKLNPPDKKRGLPFMEALSVKASVRDFSDKELSLQDLSDLAWAANGINRPDSKKTTASSAMNSQDVDVYYFMQSGVYVYDVARHQLKYLMDGDYRARIVRPRPGSTTPPSVPPVLLLLISDMSRFKFGSSEMKRECAALDAGIVSQNISLFCAATGLKTVPRLGTDRAKVTELLHLTEAQYILLNHPVGYAK